MGERLRDMRRFSGACRFVFNKALGLQKVAHEAGEKFIGYVAMAKRLTDWRNGTETPWLKDAPCHPLTPFATRAERLEAGVQKLLRQTRRLPSFQTHGQWRALSLPRCQAVQTRSG